MKIAIYSGTIPSQVFIERMIIGLAKSPNQIYLFGRMKRNPDYKFRNIHLITHRTALGKFLLLLKYQILLSILHPEKLNKLKTVCVNKGIPLTRNAKLKFYPVLFHHPDIFHIQWAKSLKEWIWIKEFGINLVLSLRGTHINISPITNPALAVEYKHLFPEVDMFHSVAESLVKDVKKYITTQSSIKVIHNGLNPEEFLQTSQIHKTSVPFRLLSVGRPHWSKGYSIALDACHLLKAASFKFSYTIVGVTTDEELLFQRKQLGLSSEVIFQEETSNQEVIRSMPSYDLLLLPSITEGIANVVLEAMASGLMVLTTDCGGMHEAITDGVNGFIIPLRDPKSMSNKILQLASLTEDMKTSVRSNARQTIFDRFNENKSIDQLLTMYQEVMRNVK